MLGRIERYDLIYNTTTVLWAAALCTTTINFFLESVHAIQVDIIKAHLTEKLKRDLTPEEQKDVNELASKALLLSHITLIPIVFELLVVVLSLIAAALVILVGLLALSMQTAFNFTVTVLSCVGLVDIDDPALPDMDSVRNNVFTA